MRQRKQSLEFLPRSNTFFKRTIHYSLKNFLIKSQDTVNIQNLCDKINLFAALETKQPTKEQLEDLNLEAMPLKFNQLPDLNTEDSPIERRYKTEIIDDVISHLLILLSQSLATKGEQDKDTQLYISKEMTRLKTYMEILKKG